MFTAGIFRLDSTCCQCKLYIVNIIPHPLLPIPHLKSLVMTILLAFTPFLAFALLENSLGMHNALLAATVISGLLIAREVLMQKKSLKPLEAVSLLMFGGLALASRLAILPLSIVGVRLIIDGGLLVVVLGSILIGRPFTLAYARDRVSAEIAATARFRKVNLMTSALWALAFAVVVAADAFMLYWPAFTATDGTIAIVTAIAGAALLTGALPRLFASKAAHS